MNAENTLVIEAVSVGYGRHIVLENIDLPPLAPGHIAALIGPNAAGKTTLLRAIARLHKARGGKMLLGGRDLLTLPAREHAAKVSYMPQALPQRVSLSVIESVMAALKASPTGPGQSLEDTHAAAAAVLDRLGIGHLAFSMLDALSGGQRQMVSLAQSICREPDILLLDEPTSALDPHHQISVMSAVRDIVREKGMIAIVVMHDLNLALDWGDTIVLIADSGVVAAGDPAQVLSPQNLATAYGIAARLETCSKGRLHVFVDALTD